MRARLPERVGPYRPLAVIGGGAYGTVYSARAQGGALVAVRVLPSWLSEDDDAKQRLFALLEELRHVVHPGLCAVYGTGEEGRAAYCVTEVAAGVDLLRLAARPLAGPEWPWMVAQVIADAAEAVGALHQVGQIHEGIKDQNVVVKWDGTVKVMDLGLERIGQTLPQTRTGTVKGRFRHYAPEKLRGGRPMPTRDVWALGVIAWELLRGGKLFDAKNDFDTLQAITSSKVPPLPPQVPAPLASIATACLAPDPRVRPPDGTSLAMALRGAVARAGVPSLHETLASRIRTRFHKEMGRWRRILEQTSDAADRETD